MGGCHRAGLRGGPFTDRFRDLVSDCGPHLLTVERSVVAPAVRPAVIMSGRVRAAAMKTQTAARLVPVESRPSLRRVCRPLGWGALVAILVVVALLVVSVVGALRTPGNESFRAKWADWLRDHHATALVVPLENWFFAHEQPSTGGEPRALNSEPTFDARSSDHLPAPPDVPLVVQPGLPSEGHWQPTGPAVNGLPAMYVAQFRADDVFTSQLTTAVRIDPRLLRVRLVPGSNEPGGTWPVPPAITGDARATAVAAFNGGFRFNEARGGFWFEGVEAVPLRDGAASIVIHRNGALDIGAWNRDVALDPEVEAVLQNLTLLVDGGQVDPAITHNDTRAWGATLKGHIAVARSGLGVTADGALVYVAGPALTAKSLAESLQRAGAVRAMALDLNPEWVTFNFYTHPDPANPGAVTSTKLYSQMQRSADRYLDPDSRDFFTVSTQ